MFNIALCRYKNGREIKPDKHYTYSYEEAEASLTISPTDGTDAGNYMVKATNKLGTVDTECSLTVHSKSWNSKYFYWEYLSNVWNKD